MSRRRCRRPARRERELRERFDLERGTIVDVRRSSLAIAAARSGGRSGRARLPSGRAASQATSRRDLRREAPTTIRRRSGGVGSGIRASRPAASQRLDARGLDLRDRVDQASGAVGARLRRPALHMAPSLVEREPMSASSPTRRSPLDQQHRTDAEPAAPREIPARWFAASSSRRSRRLDRSLALRPARAACGGSARTRGPPRRARRRRRTRPRRPDFGRRRGVEDGDARRRREPWSARLARAASFFDDAVVAPRVGARSSTRRRGTSRLVIHPRATRRAIRNARWLDAAGVVVATRSSDRQLLRRRGWRAALESARTPRASARARAPSRGCEQDESDDHQAGGGVRGYGDLDWSISALPRARMQTARIHAATVHAQPSPARHQRRGGSSEAASIVPMKAFSTSADRRSSSRRSPSRSVAALGTTMQRARGPSPTVAATAASSSVARRMQRETRVAKAGTSRHLGEAGERFWPRVGGRADERRRYKDLRPTLPTAVMQAPTSSATLAPAVAYIDKPMLGGPVGSTRHPLAWRTDARFGTR